MTSSYRRLHIEFSRVIQQITDQTGGEVTSAKIWRAFDAEYVRQQQPLAIRDHSEHSTGDTGTLTATVSDGQVEHVISGDGLDRSMRSSTRSTRHSGSTCAF